MARFQKTPVREIKLKSNLVYGLLVVFNASSEKTILFCKQEIVGVHFVSYDIYIYKI